MLGLPVRYFLRHPARAVAAVTSEPLELLTTLKERYAAQRERPVPTHLYQADASWDRKMHEQLGLPWPCPASAEFAALWPKVIREVEDKGIRVGPDTLQGWNDGDAGFV